MVERDKKLGVHRRLFRLLLISLPVGLLNPPLAGERQGRVEVLVVHPGHGPRRGYGKYSSRFAGVDESDAGT